MEHARFSQHLTESQIILVFMVLLLITVSYWFFFYDNSMVEKNVEYFKVSSNTDNTVLRASGIIIPEKTVEIKSSIAEKVVETIFEEGDSVDEKDLILKYNNKMTENDIRQAQIKKEKAEISLAQAETEVREAEASVELARTQLENAKEISFAALKEEINQAEIRLEDGKKKLKKYNYLHDKNAIELSKKEDQEYQVRILESRLNLAEQRLVDKKKEIDNRVEEAEKNLLQAEKRYLSSKKRYEVSGKSLEETIISKEKTVTTNEDYFIYSPLDGKVIEKNVEEGEYVQPGQLLYKIVSDNLLIKISPDERELGLLGGNKTGYIAPEAYPAKKIKVRLARIAPAVDNNRGTIDIYLKPVEKTDSLLPNMAVSVDIINEDISENRIYIPKDYLIDNEKVYLYKNGKALLQDISSGMTIEDKIEIKNGLEQEDIILQPDNIKTGEEINIKG